MDPDLYLRSNKYGHVKSWIVCMYICRYQEGLKRLKELQEMKEQEEKAEEKETEPEEINGEELEEEKKPSRYWEIIDLFKRPFIVHLFSLNV